MSESRAGTRFFYASVRTLHLTHQSNVLDEYNEGRSTSPLIFYHRSLDTSRSDPGCDCTPRLKIACDTKNPIVQARLRDSYRSHAVVRDVSSHMPVITPNTKDKVITNPQKMLCWQMWQRRLSEICVRLFSPPLPSFFDTGQSRSLTPLLSLRLVMQLQQPVQTSNLDVNSPFRS